MACEMPTSIDVLPPELLSQIFGYLALAPPSGARLNEQPKVNMFSSPDTPLKNISLVSKRWRAIVLPSLFRHVLWAFDRWDLLLFEPGQEVDPLEGMPLLRFLHEHDLGRHVDTLIMLVSDSMQNMTHRAEYGAALAGLSRRSGGDGDGSSGALRDAKAELFTGGSRYPHIRNRAATYSEDNNWVWDLLFGLMDLRRITIIASPQMLASLLSRMLFLGDAWSFSRDLRHILSLCRETRSKAILPPSAISNTPQSRPEPQAQSTPPSTSTASTSTLQRSTPPSSLFTIRPWTHLLLNEGSSTRVYKTYEFFLRRPPSILGALLGCEEAPNDTPLVPPTITSLSYIAIFPLSSHFNSLVSFLPRIDKLYVQLVPRNDLLRDAVEMRNVQASDLWMERNSCYGLVMRELLTSEMGAISDDEGEDANDGANGGPSRSESNWRYLREFESGDAADKDAWDMAVQYVSMSGSNWHVEREGVFVRGRRSSGSGSAEDATNNDLGHVEEPPAAEPDGGHGLDILSVPPESFTPW